MPNIKKPEDQKVETMNVSVPKAVKEATGAIAKKKKMSRSSFVSAALIEAIRKEVENHDNT